MEGDPRFQQQFARDFRVRRSCLLTWLHYLRRHHPGYRDIVVPQGPVEEASEEDPSMPTHQRSLICRLPIPN
ncbi:hypothetical protein HRG_013598 [Hirsutella rhossiliensis]